MNDKYVTILFVLYLEKKIQRMLSISALPSEVLWKNYYIFKTLKKKNSNSTFNTNLLNSLWKFLWYHRSMFILLRFSFGVDYFDMKTCLIFSSKEENKYFKGMCTIPKILEIFWMCAESIKKFIRFKFLILCVAMLLSFFL